MKQRLSERKLRRLREGTGNDYRSAWHRGGWGHGWFECHLPPTLSGLLNTDMVNIHTYEVRPKIRDGLFIHD